MSGLGPGCVKTCTSRECAELFSFFSSFDGDCQSGSFLIQRNRDKLSTRKFDIGVFTQPGPFSDFPACPSISAVGRNEMLGVSPSAKQSHWHGAARFSDKSHLDRIREERVTPLVQGPHEIRLGVDCSTFALAPFSSVGIERKVSHVVFAGLFPMVDRQRLTIVLAIEAGPHAFYAARLSRMVLREDDLQPVSPQHQNVSPLGAEETTKAQQFAIGLIGRMIARGHTGCGPFNPHAVVIVRMRSFYESYESA